MSNWNWLASTRALQKEAYGRDFDKPLDPDEFADAIVMQFAALIVELSEFMQEVGWKDWTTPRGWVNRDQAVGELVDVAHFLANILCRLDVTDEEWERRYRAKQEVNRKRQAQPGGYDGVSDKCPSCRRSHWDVEYDRKTGICYQCQTLRSESHVDVP